MPRTTPPGDPRVSSCPVCGGTLPTILDYVVIAVNPAPPRPRWYGGDTSHTPRDARVCCVLSCGCHIDRSRWNLVFSDSGLPRWVAVTAA